MLFIAALSSSAVKGSSISWDILGALSLRFTSTAVLLLLLSLRLPLTSAYSWRKAFALALGVCAQSSSGVECFGIHLLSLTLHPLYQVPDLLGVSSFCNGLQVISPGLSFGSHGHLTQITALADPTLPVDVQVSSESISLSPCNSYLSRLPPALSGSTRLSLVLLPQLSFSSPTPEIRTSSCNPAPLSSPPILSSTSLAYMLQSIILMSGSILLSILLSRWTLLLHSIFIGRWSDCSSSSGSHVALPQADWCDIR